jgi:glycosyltransferase involved in cell wall biosynthesis
MIRILETIRQGSVGGGETYLFNLVTRLDRNTFAPEVLSFTDGELIADLQNAGIPVHIIPTEKPFDIRMYPKVMQLVSRGKFDLIHYHGTRAATNTLIPARLSGKKTIYTVHGWSFHTGTSATVQRARQFAETLLVKFTDRVICGSQGDVSLGQRACGLKSYRLIRNSIDSNRFHPEMPVENLRPGFGLEPNAPVITFMARMTMQKDPLTFLRAAAILKNRFPQARFCLFGDGDLNADVDQQIKMLGLSDSVLRSSFRRDVAAVLKMTDIFVLPSLWEVIPLGLLEAMSMAVACIATDIPGTTEALINKENGRLFPVGDESALAEAITLFIEDSALRQRLGAAARETVKNRFSLDRLVRENEALYEELFAR